MDSFFKTALHQQIAAQEAEFVKRLTATGNAELARYFEFIVSLRRTADLADQLNWQTVKADNGDGVAITKAVTPRAVIHREGTDGFVLRDAVRKMIAHFNGKRFTTRQMYEALAIEHPIDVQKDRFASVSATLANLVSRNELVKSINSQRKVTFQVPNVQTETQPQFDL